MFDGVDMLLAEYLHHWLHDVKRDTIKLTTWQSYERNIRIHINPTLGRVRLDRLNPTQVRALYRERLDSDLSTRMVQLMHVTLNQALDHAVQDGLIPRSVSHTVKPPLIIQAEISPLNAEEAKTLLSCALETGDRYEPLYTPALTTGLRQGKLLGLKWEDIDLEAKTLRVRRTLSTATGQGISFNPPKTAKSRRRIRLTELAATALRAYRKGQLETRFRSAGRWQDYGLVFATGVGTSISRVVLITKSFKLILKGAKLPDIRFHDLRHTCATLLLGQGIHVKLVQELLGHSSVTIALDTYSHVLPGMDDRLADSIDAALG